ncbi:MAG: hypothetical protein H6745_25345 [Deltaproteobacteria bacterium]|nr:hypothetical protein [Deltaproteobacteria bacterium]
MNARHRHLLPFAALSTLTLLAPTGCGGDDGGGGKKLDPVECPAAPTPVDPCAGGGCVEACGNPIFLDAGAETSGFELRGRPTVRPRTARRVDRVVVGTTPWGISVLNGETAEEVGALTLPRTPIAMAEVDGALFVGTDGGSIVPIDVSDETFPVALGTWRGPESVQLVRGDGRRLILRTPDGVSVWNVSDVEHPVEERCIVLPIVGGSDRVWDAQVLGDFVVVAGGDTPLAYVYDLAVPDRQPTPVPIDNETGVVLEAPGNLVLTKGGKAILYRLVPGQSLQEVTRDDAGFGLQPLVAGGFIIGDTVALDVRNGLQRWNVVPPDATSCTVSLNALDLSSSLIVFPELYPSQRWDPEDAPAAQCPRREAEFAHAVSGAREPGGANVVIADEAGAVVWDLEVGGEVGTAQLAGDLVWVGDSILGIEKKGTDFGMAVTAEIHRVKVDDLAADPTTTAIDRPLHDWSATAVALWLVVEGAPRQFGDEAGKASDRELWRMSPGQEPTPVALEDGAQPDQVFTSLDKVYVLDEQRLVRILDLTGAEVAQVELPRGYDATTGAASSLGLLVTDECGGLAWVKPDGTLATSEPTAERVIPQAADGKYFYGFAQAGTDVEIEPEPYLIALQLSDSAGALSAHVSGRLPLPSTGGTVLPGVPTAVIQNGLYVVAGP